MFIKDVLDLDTIDVLAAADQHVLGPIDDEAETFLVQPRQIPGAHPTIDKGLGRGLGLVPIEFDHVRTLAPQLADLADGQLLGPVQRHDLHVRHRRRGSAAVRAHLVILADIAGEGGGGFGHPPAVAGHGGRKCLQDLAHQFGRRRRAAIGDALQRGQVVSGSRRMLDQLPGDGRHPARGVDLFPLDQLHRLLGVPAAHQDQLAAGVDQGRQGRIAARHMEHGHHQQGHPLRRLGIGDRRRLAAAHETTGGGDAAGHDVADDVAMRAQGALGLSGGARGVEDGGVVVGLEFDRRQGAVGQGGPVARVADHRFQMRHQRMGDLLVRARDIDPSKVRAIVQVFGQALETLGVEDGDLGSGIDQAVFQFRPGPPGVQRGDDGAQAGGREKGHRPFGQVAHGQGHPVALFHPLELELVGEGGDRLAKGGIGGALILIDHELAVAEGLAVQENIAQGRRSVLPRPRFHPADDQLLHLVQ